MGPTMRTVYVRTFVIGGGRIRTNCKLAITEALSKQFSYETFLEYLNSYLNDNIESIKMQGAGIIDLRPGFEHEGSHDVAPELDFDFDLDAAIAEASRAAETDSDPSADVSSKDEDLTAFLTASISKAAEEANGPEKEGAPMGEVASAAESATKADMQVLEPIAHSENDPDGPVNDSQAACKLRSPELCIVVLRLTAHSTTGSIITSGGPATSAAAILSLSTTYSSTSPRLQAHW